MFDKSSNFLKFWKGLCLLSIYCLPCVVALVVTLSINYGRALNSADPISSYITSIRNGNQLSQELIEDNIVLKRLTTFLQSQKDLGQLEKYDTESIRRTIITSWLSNSIFIVGLTLFPFIILGGGFAFKWGTRFPLGEMASLACKDWPMKYLVGFIISFGWLYVFNPFGQGASAIYNFVTVYDTISTDTLPFYIDSKLQMKHVVAGFLGWYLQLVGYFFYRFYKADVIGTKIYGKLFSKFLFIWGVALILSTITTKEALLLIFLLGFFPLSAVSILKEFGMKTVSGVGKSPASLAILPGISRWHILRLEEENIDNISTLATCNLEALKATIPKETIEPKLFDYWIDIAKLISVLGTEKYKSLEDFCKTASYFVEKAKDDQFTETLKQDYHIANPDEIARLLCTNFKVTV